MRHLLTVADLSAGDIEAVFAIAEDLKTKFAQGQREALLPGRVMALLFEKQSLRTRVSFEAGMTHLGGGSLMLGDDAGFGKRESIADFTRVLSGMVDVIVVRAKSHATVVEVARHSTCSVINGLTDTSHPCQALADLLTVRERFGSLKGLKLAWVGDGNNVARSLAAACGRAGVELAVATPKGYELDVSGEEMKGVKFTATNDPHEAAAGAHAVYTDVWASMGQEAEREQRQKDFADFQVNSRLMASADPEAIFLHCLPARRGEEVTDEVMDAPYSLVVQQAANRMHAQKGVLVWLLGSKA
ncbi:Ornithine carbamoyltransferase [Pirellulimonas nuda]|uniref:Ornithine carbamoyltransferase n=1 Tax=Pirellulimonas nuda TaxID=2528009 RepID=A0A518D8D4_9BACT|nr:ornithine carbamoyltransferase [Pirellulimonas nuda]QDU87715.1 Ornithine carbamoyltransferase [Pirellulimonas nuda]